MISFTSLKEGFINLTVNETVIDVQISCIPDEYLSMINCGFKNLQILVIMARIMQ